MLINTFIFLFVWVIEGGGLWCLTPLLDLILINVKSLKKVAIMGSLPLIDSEEESSYRLDLLSNFLSAAK